MNSITRQQSVVGRLPLFLDSIKFQESLFALPFAYTGMILAADGIPSWSQFIWITVAMLGARTFGMSANRIIDASIDARNPRTMSRHLPQGTLSVTDMALPAIAALVLLIVAASQLNSLAFILSPVAAGYLAVYSLAKRYTWTANLLLGWALAIAPSAAWIGVKGGLSGEPIILSTAVALWAGSFDIMYHTQDRDFYLANNLYSVAQRFGIAVALRLAKVLDGLAICALVSVGIWMDLAFPYFIGCLVVGGLLFYKHKLVSPTDLSKLGMAFFRINAYVSITVLVSTAMALSVY